MPLTDFSYAPPTDDAELQRAGDLAVDVFRFPAERFAPHAESLGKENFRVATVGGELAGTLALIRMGQFWGGRSVPMTGFGTVAVAPEFRSRGVGAQMMAAALRELREQGSALATLYPATVPVYRKVGFEIAGSNLGVKIPTARIDLREPSVDVRPMRPDDHEIMRALYRRAAAEHPGNLDRSEAMWKRLADYHGLKPKSYIFENTGQIEGYVVCAEDRTRDGKRYLDIADIVITTPAAGRRFWQFIADHRSLVEFVAMLGSPHDPLLLLLREPSREIIGMPSWMLRIVHVTDALSKRGYPLGVSAEVHLRIRDELLPQNAGDYILSVREGRPTVERGGRGTLEMDVRGLAALYTGAISATDLTAVGLLHGPEEEIAPAEALFTGPAPWMRDAF